MLLELDDKVLVTLFLHFLGFECRCMIHNKFRIDTLLFPACRQIFYRLS